MKSGNYQPLTTVRRLPCWPSEPHFDQLVEGEELKRRAINLESYWADWADVEQLTLVHGRDFDHVIFGISLGSVPILCGELVEARPEWRAMVQHVQTTPTQAFQLWFLPDIAGLAWAEDSKPYIAKGPSGVGVRSILEWVRKYDS